MIGKLLAPLMVVWKLFQDDWLLRTSYSVLQNDSIVSNCWSIILWNQQMFFLTEHLLSLDNRYVLGSMVILLKRITIGPSTKWLTDGRSECSVKSSYKKIANHLSILQNGWPSFEHYKMFWETKVLRTIFTQPLVGRKIGRSSVNCFILGLMVMLDEKSQVKQCLGFCTADFWSSLVYESAEKPKHCITWDFISALMTRWKTPSNGPAARALGIEGHPRQVYLLEKYTVPYPLSRDILLSIFWHAPLAAELILQLLCRPIGNQNL